MKTIRTIKSNGQIHKHLKEKYLKYLKCMFYEVLELFRLLLALLMGVVMDLLDFGPKPCPKLYFFNHKNDRKKMTSQIALPRPKTRNKRDIAMCSHCACALGLQATHAELPVASVNEPLGHGSHAVPPTLYQPA